MQDGFRIYFASDVTSFGVKPAFHTDFYQRKFSSIGFRVSDCTKIALEETPEIINKLLEIINKLHPCEPQLFHERTFVIVEMEQLQ